MPATENADLDTLSLPCDLCGTRLLEPVYRADGTTRDLTVHICGNCGLVQSLPRIDHVDQRKQAVSSGADWGNIRYGKGFRTEKALSLMEPHVKWGDVTHCLDVGANRGGFIAALHERAPQAQIVAVEPDAKVMDAYRDAPSVDAVHGRIEGQVLPAGRFDFIYCSHTLEHLASPAATLRQLHKALHPNGRLYVEVPDIAYLERDDWVEEWFIDKHLYHFSHEVLAAYLAQAGFEQVFLIRDDSNLCVLARRSEGTGRLPVLDGQIARREKKLVAAYSRTLGKNRAKLQQVARRMEAMCASQRVVIWGAGRIFDSIVIHGDLDLKGIVGVVDRHLVKHVSWVHGILLAEPDEITRLRPDLVVISSRAYAAEIAAEIRAMMDPAPRITTFADLMADRG